MREVDKEMTIIQVVAINFKKRVKIVHDQTVLDSYLEKVTIPLQMKTEELILLGYDSANVSDVWDSVKDKFRRKKQEKVELHEVIGEILSLQSGHYIQTMTRKSWAELEKKF